MVTNSIHKMSEKKKTFPMRNMPKSIRDIILKHQVDEKIKCNCTRSMEWTIYSIIREWDDLKKQSKFIANDK